jgi:hypothetical protein
MMNIKQDYKNTQKLIKNKKRQERREVIEAVIAFTVFGYMVAYTLFMFITGG